MISLKQLQAFTSIARYGNLSTAANELFLSKGALSQSLAQLERQLGQVLFDRVHPRLQLNEQGRQLQPLAEEILSRVMDVEHLFAEQGTPTGSLRLGASQTIGNYVLPAILAQQPQLHKVQITHTQALCEKILRFELDLALVEGEHFPPPLISQDWLTDELLVVANPQHELFKRYGEQLVTTPLKLAQLANQAWVLRERESGIRQQFEQQLAPKLAPLGQVLELNTIESIMQAAEHGLGLAFVSRRAAGERISTGRLKVVPLDRMLSRTFKLVWHKQKYHSASLSHFIELCLQHMNKPLP
ncbi:LysR substrate-binding domain-containing protein [Oceanisphaera avium]|uniref:LysR family transcriptional regulator n=1 Tax=Oceanisphaera avium TaxID=1903694 RepID=A0A1Y0CYZ1_9GAMM|nr:LysR substrate-binding domain-containing protein [Oceanisphaera avium]ART80488.1 LysR family transcriptional regulator [Oceanisphaera avium]